MIGDGIEITPGMICRRDVDPAIRYAVEDVRTDLTGWERTQDMGRKAVNYAQLDDGAFPAGTPWSRSEEDFRQNFTPIEQ